MKIPNSTAVAVFSDEGKLTYAELHERSARLAARLNELGAGPETLIGLCFPRSIALVVGAVGILKSGAAYLPIDPSSPPDRVGGLLTDSGVRIVVASEQAARLLPKGDWQVIVLDLAGNGAGFPDALPDAEFPIERLAYVIYTSGSTGAPKGVEVTHSNLAHLIRWHHRAFAVTAADRATLFASPGFDASVWEMWPYLAKGAALHIPPDPIRISPAALRDWILKEKISVSFLPTALAERMLDLKWPPAQTSLRFLLTGADTLRRRPSAGLPFEFVNNYGPTECTVVATSGVVATAGEDGDQPPSIGKAIDGAVIEIRDGELLIGGGGVARGYRNQPALTAERFIDDPEHGRMYRTGDLASWLPNGEIAFHGRIDDQIKIRGFRIEPNEIVRALAKIPTVRESAVVLRGPIDVEKRLIAYIVPNSTTELSERGLQETLRKSLPDYMMPSAFVLVDSLPYTENGKLDRNALPEPSAANSIRDDEFEAPSNPLEEKLAATVAELLHTDRVGIKDNFFLLGGHSLMGAQLVDRINRDFGVELTLRSVFDYPTVEGLAGEIEAAIFERVESMSEEEAQRLLN
jgi:amino acid adenylation domain-containing protein